MEAFPWSNLSPDSAPIFQGSQESLKLCWEEAQSRGRGGGKNSESSVWPGEASKPSFFPEKMILQQAIWFTRWATGEHLVLPLTWIRAKSEGEKNNNNAAWGCQARAPTAAGLRHAPRTAPSHPQHRGRGLGHATQQMGKGSLGEMTRQLSRCRARTKAQVIKLQTLPEEPQQPLTPASLSCACLPAATFPRKEGSLKRDHMAQIPSFHRDTREQDLISQLLSRLQIFTSKYFPICHIFASSSLGVYPRQVGGSEAW